MMFIPINGLDNLMNLADHIEMDHERELSGMIPFSRLQAMHEAMHDQHDDWGHTHNRTVAR